MNRKFFGILGCIFVVGALLCGIGFVFNGNKPFSVSFYKDSYNNKQVSDGEVVTGTIDLEDFDNINFDVSSIDVIVVPGNESKLEYSVFKEYVPEVSYSGKTLNVKQPSVNVSFNFTFDIATKIYYKLTVPSDKKYDEILIDASSAEISIENIEGDVCKVVTSSGDADIKNCKFNEINREASSGGTLFDTISVKTLYSQASSGDIEVKNMAADEVEASTTSGNIEIFDLTCLNLNTEASSGNIEVEKISVDKVETETTSGNNKFKFEKVNSVFAKASSGNVTLYLTGNEDEYDFDLSASSGNIECGKLSLEKKYKTEKGTGRMVDVSTTSGDINLSFAK